VTKRQKESLSLKKEHEKKKGASVGKNSEVNSKTISFVSSSERARKVGQRKVKGVESDGTQTTGKKEPDTEY